MLQEFVAHLLEFYVNLNLPEFWLNNSSLRAWGFFVLRPEAVVWLEGGELHRSLRNVFFLEGRRSWVVAWMSIWAEGSQLTLSSWFEAMTGFVWRPGFVVGERAGPQPFWFRLVFKEFLRHPTTYIKWIIILTTIIISTEKPRFMDLSLLIYWGCRKMENIMGRWFKIY